MLIRKPKKKEAVVASADLPGTSEISGMTMDQPKRLTGQKTPIMMGGKPRMSGQTMVWKDPDRTDHAILESSLGSTYSIPIPDEVERAAMNREAKRLDEEFQESLRSKAKKKKKDE